MSHRRRLIILGLGMLAAASILLPILLWRHPPSRHRLLLALIEQGPEALHAGAVTRLSEEAPATAPHLLRAACRASEDARPLAARALRDIGPEAIAALAAALRGADPALRELAREQLAMLLARCEGDPRLIAWSGPRAQAAGPDLAALLSTDDPNLAALAGGALAHLAYGESLSGEVQAALRERAASEGPGARLAAEVLAICAAGIRHNERP